MKLADRAVVRELAVEPGEHQLALGAGQLQAGDLLRLGEHLGGDGPLLRFLGSEQAGSRGDCGQQGEETAAVEARRDVNHPAILS